MLQFDKRKKSFYDFGKSMKNYSITRWIFEILNIFLNILAILGITVFLLIYFDPNGINFSTLNILTIIYSIIMIMLLILFSISALINFLFFIFYLVKLSDSSQYDQNRNLKKSFIMEIISIVLIIILPITLEILDLMLGIFIPEYNYSFIIPDFNSIYYDLTLTSLTVAIIIFVLRIINGYIPRIFKATAQKNLRKWTDDLFETPFSSTESENLEPEIMKGSKLMKIGQILGIFRIVRLIGKMMYIVGLTKTGKGLINSFKNYMPQNYINVKYPTSPQQNNIFEDDGKVHFCAFCGSDLIPNSKFCGKCGKTSL